MLTMKRDYRIKAEDIPQLTVRQMQIARLVEQGFSNEDIGRQLGIGVPAVSSHLGAIYRKFGFGSYNSNPRAELILAVRLLKLV